MKGQENLEKNLKEKGGKESRKLSLRIKEALSHAEKGCKSSDSTVLRR